MERVMDRIGDRVVVASVSGGKDSTAMCLHLKELGIPYEAVFMDTGWENAETYRYLREELPSYIGPIRWLRSEAVLPPDLDALARVYEARLGHYSAMVRWCLKKGMFPSGRRRWCTEELKVRPMGKYLASLDAEAVNVVGVRAEESAARAALAEWEMPPDTSMIDAETWRPLIQWKTEDVIAIHHRHGVIPNRGYLGAARRVGCWPCIRSAKAEIRNIADTDPGRIDLLADLERDIGRLARERMERKGTTLEAEGYHEPVWFQSPIRDESGGSPCWPIDRVVEWSRTAHGGRQFELFAPRDHEAGCVRWGMCDLSQKEAEWSA